MKVKEKKVELIELFYDLIYVYALSKLTMLIEEPENGVIPFAGFFRYLVVCFVILQAWLYLTNYWPDGSQYDGCGLYGKHD